MAKKNELKDVEKDVEKNIENDDYEELSLEDRITNIEKKVNVSFWLNIAILLLVIITLIFSLGNGTDLTTKTPTTDSTEEVAYDTSAFKQISPSDIAKESDGKTIVVWVGRQSCGYCAMYAPNIAKAADEYGITAYYVDLGTMIDFSVEQPYITDADEFDTLSNLSGKGEWATFAYDNVGGTPLTLIIKDNKVIGGVNVYTDVDTITAAFKAAGIKKK